MKTRANPSIKRIFAYTTLCFSSLLSTISYANNCTTQQIDHYLEKGFSHDQVVKLCTTKPKTTQQAAPLQNGNLYDNLSGNSKNTAPPTTASSSIQNSNSQDELYFSTVLEANPVRIDNEKLSYDSKECAVYGEIDMTQLRDKACIRSRVNIYFKGLQVISAKKGIPLIQEQELVVKGNITREYLDTGKLNKYQMQAVQEQLPQQTTKQDIPVKKGINPKDVVARLNRFIN